MNTTELDFYQKLRTSIRTKLETRRGAAGKLAEYLLSAPDLFHLLCRLSVDKDVAVVQKAKLGAVIAYFIAPFDLMPEAVFGLFGFVDDIALAAYMLNSFVKTSDPAIVKRHWAGDDDVLDVIQKAMNTADSAGGRGLVGKNLWKKLKKIIK